MEAAGQDILVKRALGSVAPTATAHLRFRHRLITTGGAAPKEFPFLSLVSKWRYKSPLPRGPSTSHEK
jgi:hypothetical protein